MNLSYSKHAITRIQQRGLRSEDIELVIQTGTSFDNDSIVLLNQDVDREIKIRKHEIKMLERLRSVRVVLGEDDNIVTAYHTHRNIEKYLLRGLYRYKSKYRYQ